MVAEGPCPAPLSSPSCHLQGRELLTETVVETQAGFHGKECEKSDLMALVTPGEGKETGFLVKPHFNIRVSSWVNWKGKRKTREVELVIGLGWFR